MTSAGSLLEVLWFAEPRGRTSSKVSLRKLYVATARPGNGEKIERNQITTAISAQCTRLATHIFLRSVQKGRPAVGVVGVIETLSCASWRSRSRSGKIANFTVEWRKF